MADWVDQSEARRRSESWAGLATVVAGMVALAAGLLGRHGQDGELLWLLLLVVGTYGVTVGLVSLAVRPLSTPEGASYLVLLPTPGGGSTAPHRLTVADGEVRLRTRGRSGDLLAAWPLASLRDLSVRRVWGPRPLGYLSLRTPDGALLEGRVFQPRALRRSLGLHR